MRGLEGESRGFDVDEQLQAYLRATRTSNTLATYRSDLSELEEKGGSDIRLWLRRPGRGAAGTLGPPVGEVDEVDETTVREPNQLPQVFVGDVTAPAVTMEGDEPPEPASRLASKRAVRSGCCGGSAGTGATPSGLPASDRWAPSAAGAGHGGGRRGGVSYVALVSHRGRRGP